MSTPSPEQWSVKSKAQRWSQGAKEEAEDAGDCHPVTTWGQSQVRWWHQGPAFCLLQPWCAGHNDQARVVPTPVNPELRPSLHFGERHLLGLRKGVGSERSHSHHWAMSPPAWVLLFPQRAQPCSLRALGHGFFSHLLPMGTGYSCGCGAPCLGSMFLDLLDQHQVGT